MRRRAWIAIASAIAALALGFIQRSTSAPLDALAGILWLIAIVLTVSLLPFWRTVLPSVPPMPGLFQPVQAGQRWCTRCGTPADQDAPCGVCGHARAVRPPKARAKPKSGKRSR